MTATDDICTDDIYAVIMAGGSGSRFWPQSRRTQPKQLLPLGPTEVPLVTDTVRRATQLVPPERVIVVTHARQAEGTRKALPTIPEENLLLEPMSRNTAPCLGWATAVVRRRNPNAVIMALPADHYIPDDAAFVEDMRVGLVTARTGSLVTVGIRPTRPETGYGYIELGAPRSEKVYQARRFVEKPNRRRAEQFLASGRFLWNSGIFFFTAERMLEALKSCLPGLSKELDAYDAAAARGEERALVEATYDTLPCVSFDHGVMEKAEDVSVLPASFDWADLGSWTTAYELAEKDADDNALPSMSVAIDAKGCLARTREGKVVALVGVRDLVVVDTDDAILIMPRSRAQDVRDVVTILKDRKLDRFL